MSRVQTNAVAAITAPAKVNLTLKILGRRPDGYHELESLVVFADQPADRMTVTLAPETSISVTGPFKQFIGPDNLVLTALEHLRANAPGLQLGTVDLEKAIPVAAGLGGGSADAAALLRAVRQLNPDIDSTIDWQSLAANLGADVPVCLESSASKMRGIGERVCPLPAFPEIYAVLVNSQTPVPDNKTQTVFAKLAAPPLKPQSEHHGTAHEHSDPEHNLTSLDAVLNLLQQHGNDLEHPATKVMPEIATIKAQINQTNGCEVARLSGAGPTCFGLYKTRSEAEAAASDIAGQQPDWWVTATTLR